MDAKQPKEHTHLRNKLKTRKLQEAAVNRKAGSFWGSGFVSESLRSFGFAFCGALSV